MIARLTPREFRRRPEWPVVRGWLEGLSFPRRLGGDFFFSRPRVDEAWVCPLMDGEAVLVYLSTGGVPGSSTWTLVLGEIVFPLKVCFSSEGWMSGRGLVSSVLLGDFGPELARRVAYGEATAAELEAEVVLRTLGGLVS